MANDMSLGRRTLLRSAVMSGAAVSTTQGQAFAGTGSSAATETAETGTARSRTARGSMIDVPFEGHDEVRIGIVGVGNRGFGLLNVLLTIPQVRVTAIADVYAPRARSAAARVAETGQPQPAVYTGGAPSYDEAPQAAYDAAVDAARRAASEQLGDHDDYRGLCARDDVDLVLSITPWEWHYPTAMAAMRAGKHVAVELPMAMELDHLWRLVRTSERTQRHCIQIENVSYGQNELRLLRMAHAGLFGEVTHGAGGYLHDLRHNLFFRANRDSDALGVLYRRPWHTRLDACLYPNHGLAPIAACMDINRGDRFVRLSSTTTEPLGLAAFREDNVPKDDPAWKETYVNGDRNSCVLETARGRRVRVEHDVTSPRPYSRINSLAGTSGIFEDYEPRIYLEPEMSDHQWGSWEDYADYDHWLWTDIGDTGGGHGGMDYLMLWRLIQTMRLGLVPDIDVYDSATWSAPVALSATSLQRGGKPVPYPDFTGGRWREYRPGLDTERPDE